jgi:hypothetical protein
MIPTVIMLIFTFEFKATLNGPRLSFGVGGLP